MKKNNIPVKIFKLLSVMVVITFITIAGFTLLSILGFSDKFNLFVVESGSMDPSIPKGSMVLVTPTNDYKEGDVIAFKTPFVAGNSVMYTVTHRVNKVVNENGVTKYQTKGDANTESDTLLIDNSNIIGEVNSSLPLVGYVIGFGKTKIGFIAVVLIPTLFIIFTELNTITRELKKNLDSKQKQIKRPLLYTSF